MSSVSQLPAHIAESTSPSFNRQVNPKYTKRIPIHIRSIAQPTFDLRKSLAYTQGLYASIDVHFDIQSNQGMALKKNDLIKLSTINGACTYNQSNAEHTLLYKLAGLTKKDGLVVFIVKGIQKPNGGILNGCAGFLPGSPSVIVSSTASIFTIAHEIGHVLLGAYAPSHTKSKRNIMFGGGTNNIPANSFPSFDQNQKNAIHLSPYLKPF